MFIAGYMYVVPDWDFSIEYTLKQCLCNVLVPYILMVSGRKSIVFELQFQGSVVSMPVSTSVIVRVWN
jgi:hypothetical protein